ncbi:MAG: O-antigen ligase family protein, partial [Gammaproteobacteria bacterium]|nr:O-antigen ligase family protein [Gammaproteobacteria bacterium]
GLMFRAHGLNPETHTLVTFLLIALPFALYAVTRGGSTGHTIFSGAVVVTIIMGIVFTWSYGGIIAVCVILGLFPFFMRPNRSIHYLLALLMIPVFLYAADLISVIWEILRDEASMSTGIFQRKMLNLIALDELSRNPWIGRGFETVQFFSGNYIGRPVHNAYLQAWTATGPIGFVVFTSMMFIFTTSTFILGFSGSGEREYQLRMVTIALIAFMILMISEPTLYSPSTWLLLGFAQALILLYGRKSDNSRSTDSTLAIVGRAHRQRRKKHKDE